MDRSGFGEGGSKHSQRRSSLWLRGAFQPAPQGSGQAVAGGATQRGSISAEALRTQSRLSDKNARPRRDQASRTLAEHDVSPQVREVFQSSFAAKTDPGQTAGAASTGRETFREGFVEDGASHSDMKPGMRRRRKLKRIPLNRRARARGVLLEVFAGSARLCKAFRRQGWETWAWDSKLGPSFDLTSPRNLKNLLAKLVQVDWVHIATPCGSFSAARRGRPGSPGGPLRTKEFPYGIPGLPETDLKKTEIGNKLLAATISIIETCLRYHVPVCLENPRSSQLWFQPSLLKVLSHATRVHVDYCGYGTRWKKATTFASWHADSLTGLHAKCQGHPSNKLRVCGFTQKTHLHLEGKSPDGRLWTVVAEPYPHKLCNKYAHLASDQMFPLKSGGRLSQINIDM